MVARLPELGSTTGTSTGVSLKAVKTLLFQVIRPQLVWLLGPLAEIWNPQTTLKGLARAAAATAGGLFGLYSQEERLGQLARL